MIASSDRPSGQDDEAAAELRATIRGEHSSMKIWYNESPGRSLPAIARMHDSFGLYPAFAAEVEAGWSGWREARRWYLTFTEKGAEALMVEAPPAAPAGAAASVAPNTAAGRGRKRRSRWAAAPSSDGAAAPEGRRRRSRWASGPAGAPGGAPPPGDILPGLPSTLTLDQMRELSKVQADLRSVSDRLENLESEAKRVDALPTGHGDRSPSPPPVYGMDGHRLNTRAMRWRERYENERADLMERIVEINPTYKVPGGYVRRKRQRKIFVPVREHPTYNFIGLIIGPRGKTQKEMEEKTNCKIAIRGRGSVKEGARGRRDGKPMEGENEDLHVVVTGDTQDDVDAAAAMVEQMLVVIDDDKNEHKQAQLRELALLNGTLKEDDYCQFCAEKGHRSFECPRRFAVNAGRGGASVVKCAICGDTSHPTRDCTQKGDLVQKDEKQLDSAYMSFMAELDGKDAAAVQAASAAAAASSAAVRICQSVGAEPMTAKDIIAAVQQARGADSEAPQVFDLTNPSSLPPAPVVEGAAAAANAAESKPPEVFDLSDLSKLKESVEAQRKAQEEAAAAAAAAPLTEAGAASEVKEGDVTATSGPPLPPGVVPAGYPPGYVAPAGGPPPPPPPPGYPPGPGGGYYGPADAPPQPPQSTQYSAATWQPGAQGASGGNHGYYGNPPGPGGYPAQGPPGQGGQRWDYSSFYGNNDADAAVQWWD